MAYGVVRYFDPNQNVGAIIPDDGGPELYVHGSKVQSDRYPALTDGQKVRYELGQSKSGPVALKVKSVT